MSIPARTKYIVISILSILATINFTKTTLNVIKSSKRLEGLQGEVIALEDQEGKLKQDIDKSKTFGFIEKEARERLNMILPGEQVYVVPDDDQDVLSSKDLYRPKVSDRSTKSNVQLWLDLFF